MNLHEVAEEVPAEMQLLIDWLSERWRGLFEFRWQDGAVLERCIEAWVTSPEWHPTDPAFWLPKMREATR